MSRSSNNLPTCSYIGLHSCSSKSLLIGISKIKCYLSVLSMLSPKCPSWDHLVIMWQKCKTFSLTHLQIFLTGQASSKSVESFTFIFSHYPLDNTGVWLKHKLQLSLERMLIGLKRVVLELKGWTIKGQLGSYRRKLHRNTRNLAFNLSSFPNVRIHFPNTLAPVGAIRMLGYMRRCIQNRHSFNRWCKTWQLKGESYCQATF